MRHEDWLTIARPDGWKATIEPYKLNRVLLKFYSPVVPGSAFLTVEGPDPAACAALAVELLWKGEPIPIEQAAHLGRPATFIELMARPLNPWSFTHGTDRCTWETEGGQWSAWFHADARAMVPPPAPPIAEEGAHEED